MTEIALGASAAEVTVGMLGVVDDERRGSDDAQHASACACVTGDACE
jgi:hypothetical protein